VEKREDADSDLIVHLIRHGQTASYDHDAGLTELGQAQVRHRGTELLRLLRMGDRVTFGYSSTERAASTAGILRDTILDQAEIADLQLVGKTIGPEHGYRNVQVWVDGIPWEPTKARAHLDELVAGGKTACFGWAVEAERFWRAHEETGDAMTFWLSTPLVWHDSPGVVVKRALRTTMQKFNAGLRGRLIIATHSGLLRALVYWASGKDPGEPENADDVIVVAAPGNDQVKISYRDQEWSMPTSGIAVTEIPQESGHALTSETRDH
jgi:broad specificity phosphatase PhoE